MKCCKFKIKANLKKTLASFLAVTMLGFQANLMAFASNITGVTGNNGVYNIDPVHKSGNTGFRHYNDFTLDAGHTANLIFNGINKFVNAVDNGVTINGILNSVNGNGAFANGHAIFVSPKGFVVGSSGVVNVGALGVYAPTDDAYNSFLGKYNKVNFASGDLMNDLGQLKIRGVGGNATINGLIFTKEGVVLNVSTLGIGEGNAGRIGTGFSSSHADFSQEGIAKAANADIARKNANALFNMLVNVGKGNTDSNITFDANKNGNISIVAQSPNMLKINLDIVANGDVDIKLKANPEYITNRELTDSSRYGFDFTVDGDVYTTGNYNLEYAMDKDAQKAILRTLHPEFSEQQINKLLQNSAIIFNGLISAKNVGITNNALGGLFISNTGVINATESITLTNYGHNFATFGKLTLNNYNNVANSAINIFNYLQGGSAQGEIAYISGDITTKNAALNIMTDAVMSDKTVSTVLASDGKINVTNGDININNKGSNLITEKENEIKINNSGNLNIETASTSSALLLKGKMDVAGDVNIKHKGREVFGILGDIVSGNNTTIANEGTSSLIVSGSILSNNDINIYDDLNSQIIATRGNLTSNNGNISIIHNGQNAYGVRPIDITKYPVIASSTVGAGFRVIIENEASYLDPEASTKIDYSYIGNSGNVNSLYVGDMASIKTNNNGTITLKHTGTNGGIDQNGTLNSSNGINIINSGNKGIALNKDMQSLEKTYIYDDGTSGILIKNKITTGDLEIQNSNKGNINITSVINANGNALVKNNTDSRINIVASGELNNAATNGTTKIVNESANSTGINISGKLGAKNATTITNKGNSLINITGDVVGNVAGVTIEQTNDGENGGIKLSKGITTDGYLTIDNKGQKGISLANGANTTSKGKTTIKDTSNVGINIGKDSKITAGSLLIDKSGKGGINLNGTVNSQGDTLVVNYGTDSINIANAFEGGKTTIYNDVNGDDINISGTLTTNGDTMIVQGGNGVLNISNALTNKSNGSTIISNVNGNGLKVADITTNGFTLIENASLGDIVLNGDTNTNSGDLSIQNQNYQIEINKTANNDSNLVKLNRTDNDATNKDGGIVAKGSLKGNNVYIQNSGSKGIETNGNIEAREKLMITTDNAGINLKSGNISGKNVIVSASNKTTGGITVNANVSSEDLMLIENAGKGNIAINGVLNGNSGDVLIENQTYDISTPRAAFNNDYIVLDVNRVDNPSQNVDGGIIANGTILGNNIYIQNSGKNGITSDSNVTAQGDIMITNNNGNINLVSGNISGDNVIVSNSNKAGALTSNANILASNMALIENAGKGDMTVGGNVQGALVSLQNQTYDIETPRVVNQSNGLITLGVKRNNADSQNKDSSLVTSGTIKGDTVYLQNSGNGGIKSNSDIESTGSVFVTNNGGALKLKSGTINAKDATISNSNQASGGILVGANVNTKRNGKLVVENASSGSITMDGNLNGNGGYVIIENQTYDITTPRAAFNNDYIVLDVNRVNNPSQNVDGGIIANGTILGGDVFIQNGGSNGISINNDILSDNLMITNDNGGINIGNVNLTAQNRNVLISNSSNATGGISIAANVNANNGDVVVENSGNGNIELKDTSSLSANRVLVENQTYDISTPRVPEGNYILLGVDRNKATSPNKNGEIIANGNISAKDVVYIQNSGEKGITTNGDIKGGDVAITNNGGAININNGDIDGNKVIISQSNQGEGGVTIGSNVKGADRVLIENAGKGDITIGGNVEGKKVSIQNQTYDIVTPQVKHNDGLITLDVTRIDQDSPNKDGGIKIDGNITASDDTKIQNSGEKGITTNGDIKGGDVAITNNGGAININNGDIDGNKVIISQSNQGEGGVTIGSNVKGADRVLIENAGKGDITIGGNVESKKVSIQNQTYDIVTPRNTDDNPYIALDVTRIDQDSPNKDGGIKIDGNVTGSEENKIQNSGENGITTNGDIKGGDVDITNNGGDVNINGNVDGDDVTISNSDNGGDVNINGKVDGNDVLVENNGSGNINNPENINGDVKDHEYGIETPRNTDDDPYISLDVKRNPFPPKPEPTPDPTPVIRDNDPTRLIYDRKRDDSFLELKRESIRYGINGDSLSLNSASNHIQSIVDISKTGLAVKTDGSLKINDEVKVNFAYKGIEVEATAKVMRVNQSNNIAGLRFTDLDSLTANKILYLSMLNDIQKEQTASNNQNQQPSFMNVLSKL